MQFVNIEQSLSFSHTEERKALHFQSRKENRENWMIPNTPYIITYST